MTNWTPDLKDRVGPLYRVIADALGDDIASGRLAAGARLPTHRDLAFRLSVTVGTVTRAYAEAEKRGLIGGEVGRGTFVRDRSQVQATMSPDWPERVAPTAVMLTTILPDQSDAAGALAKTLGEIARSNDLSALIGYAPHAGAIEHRRAAADWMERRHRVRVAPDDVLLATGAQNATAVALSALTRPGDVVLTERLTNYGLKVLCPTLGLHLEGAATDDDGLVPDAFDAACRRFGPKILYTVPTLHNPTAIVTSTERRLEIIQVARRHGVTIMEDDVFGFLVDDATPYHALAPDISVFITSLSKSVIAGLRVGHVAAPSALVPRMESTARSLHYAIPALPLEIATRWIDDGTADRLADGQTAEARARQALARRILPIDAVRGDAGAQHLWLELPEPWRNDEFVIEARRRSVHVLPADTFVIGRAGAPHAVRLSLCAPGSRGELERGLRILASVLDGPPTARMSVV